MDIEEEVGQTAVCPVLPLRQIEVCPTFFEENQGSCKVSALLPLK